MKNCFSVLLLACLILIIPFFCCADVVLADTSHILTGPLESVQESQSKFYWGDGLNDLYQTWSLRSETSGWFYGSSHQSSNVDVYVYKNLLDPTQIKDASIFPYSDDSVFAEEGDTVFFKGENGFYGAWVIKDLHDDASSFDGIWNSDGIWYLDGIWYFVGNGSPN